MLKLKGSMGLVGAEALPDNRRYAYLTIVGDGLGGYILGLTKLTTEVRVRISMV